MYIVFVFLYIIHWLPVTQVHVMTENSIHAPYVLFLYYIFKTSVCIRIKLHLNVPLEQQGAISSFWH